MRGSPVFGSTSDQESWQELRAQNIVLPARSFPVLIARALGIRVHKQRFKVVHEFQAAEIANYIVFTNMMHCCFYSIIICESS